MLLKTIHKEKKLKGKKEEKKKLFLNTSVTATCASLYPTARPSGSSPTPPLPAKAGHRWSSMTTTSAHKAFIYFEMIYLGEISDKQNC